MKVAITAQGSSLDAALDPRFGRCQYLLLCDTAGGDLQAVPNPVASQPGGVGIAMAQYLTKEKVQALITGNLGPNAARALAAAGIGAYIAQGGSATAALQAFVEGRLEQVTGPTVSAHSGM